MQSFSEIILLTKTIHKEELQCWLDWHLNIIKFDKIMVFDNESPVNVKEICNNFGDKVKYKLINGFPKQHSLYNEYLKKCNSTWLIAMDDDEFLFIGDKYQNNINIMLSELQKKYNNNKIYVLWTNMFSKNIQEEYSDLLIKDHTYYSYEACNSMRKEYFSDNSLGKCFINKSNDSFEYAFGRNSIGHIPICKTSCNKTILEDGTVIKSEHVHSVNEINKNCFIAHYQYKNQNDWLLKCNSYQADAKEKRLLRAKDVYKNIFKYNNTFKECNLVKELWEKYNNTTE